jgi:hypothetical protein
VTIFLREGGQDNLYRDRDGRAAATPVIFRAAAASRSPPRGHACRYSSNGSGFVPVDCWVASVDSSNGFDVAAGYAAFLLSVLSMTVPS